jgi:hypothetical protein
MKTRILLLLLLTWSTSVVHSQNLVPNPSFEDTIACPTTANQLNNCAFWSVVCESPDYFHECDFITGNTSVPYNFAGFQYPATGSAYVGIVTYTEVGSNIREIITCELINPLVVGQKYFGSMKVSWSGVIATIATNKIGMLFSTQLYSPGTAYPVNNFSHIYSNMIITDSLNWTTISGSFVADSNYQYLLLGNFFDDANTDTLRNQPFTAHAYYWIDDIIVVPDTINTYIELANHYGLSVFPNPCKDYLTISMKHVYISEVEIYDVLSKRVKHIDEIYTNEIVVNLSDLNSGIYYGRIITNNRILFIKISKI